VCDAPSPAQISSTDYAILREYRRANNITSQQHLFVLNEVGWTLDEFEVGSRCVLPRYVFNNKIQDGNRHS
jgi:hypothetical protein